MSIEQEIQNILDRNFTRGDNAKALKELLVLYNVVGRSEQFYCLSDPSEGGIKRCKIQCKGCEYSENARQ